MRCVIQRVKKASVEVGEETVGRIGAGLLVFLGVGAHDQDKDVSWMAEKILGLRIFEDEEGKMNKSVQDVGGEILLVSQFTLYGDCRKGKRPSFSEAASPQTGKVIYEQMIDVLKASGLKVETGIFQAHMEVSLCNDGPVTMLLDSEKTF